ncbi:MAG: DUF2752 domain-containing protein [Defluviitaleaceae bacterium]|nr:DUF2752 domain-containing protein [Defluviitaleaceae bacterium]
MEKLRKRVLIFAVAAPFALLFVAWLFWFTGSICFLQATVGFPCPACGSTRAAVLLFSGQFVAAHEYMPLIIVSLAFLAYAAVRYTVFFRTPFSKKENAVLLIVLALYLIVYFVRMIFLFPHTPPMIMNDGAILRQILQIL